MRALQHAHKRLVKGQRRMSMIKESQCEMKWAEGSVAGRARAAAGPGRGGTWYMHGAGQDKGASSSSSRGKQQRKGVKSEVSTNSKRSRVGKSGREQQEQHGRWAARHAHLAAVLRN